MNIEYLADHQSLIPVLADWFYLEWSYLHPGKSREDIQQMISLRIHKDRVPLTLVALQDSELIGSVSLKISDMDNRPELTPWLAALYVRKDCRSRSIGSKLITAIENKGRDLGVTFLYLFTPASEAYYAKRGWQVLERMVYHGYPVTLMTKNLSQLR
jgi:N-acetylglutamate synthase-like GNAT family acetyltransferase